MKYEDIKNFEQRCEVHPDRQSGMITNQMLEDRLYEEIDELRAYIEQRTWVGLTPEEMHKCYEEAANMEPYMGAITRVNVVKAIEAKLKEKNT